MPLLQEIINSIEIFAPLSLQEDYDNAGLLVGNRETEIRKAIVSLDCIEKVVDEAIANEANLIICHHPILFKGIRSLTGANYIEKVIIKAIKNDIAIYAAHTNLDNVKQGVNSKIAQKLGLENISVLKPKSNTLNLLYVYVPKSHADKVRDALFAAGAGNLGNYSHCSFNISGEGTFWAQEGAKPFVGDKENIHTEDEVKIEVIFTKSLKYNILSNLFESHPYEEIAYGILELSNSNQLIGAGMIGELSKEMTHNEFLKLLKMKMQTQMIRYTTASQKYIKKIAMCGGAGSFLLNEAKSRGADAFITGDFKYHEFFDAENEIMICDIGHYESEQFTSEIFIDLLSEKFPNFAVQISNVNTNPVHYY